MYKCIKSWKRHAAGVVITEWEYRKLPINILEHFERIEQIQTNEIAIVPDEPELQSPQSDTTDVQITVDPFAEFKEKRKRFRDVQS